MGDNHSSTSAGSVSRRRFIEASIGGVVVAGLAGCAGDGDGGDTDTTTAGDGTTPGDGDTDTPTETEVSLVDDTYTAASEGPPPENAQFNLFNPTGTLGDRQGFAYDRLAIRQDSRQEWIPVVASDWSIEDSVEIELYEGHTWQTGDEITAEDLVTRFKIDRFLDDPLFQLVDGVSATGDYTVELPISNPDITTGLITESLFPDRWMCAPESVFGEDVTALEEATSEDERNSLISDLSGRSFDTPEQAKRVCSGLFAFDGTDSQNIYLTKYDGYVNQYLEADDLHDFDVELRYYADRQTNLRDWENDVYDGGAADGSEDFWGPILDQDWVHQKGTPLPDGHALFYNHDDPVYGNRKVRQAFTYVLNQENIALNAPYLPQTTQVQEWNVGLVEPVIDKYVDTSGFLEYERDLDRATQLMQEAGFTKSGGEWTGQIDGQGLQATVKMPPWWQQQGTTAADQLKQFGVPLDTLVQESSTFEADLSDGNYRLASFAYGGGYHPFTAYTSDHGFTGVANYVADETKTVPPVGQPDAEPSLEINPQEEIDSLRTASGDETNEITTRLAWLYNWEAFSSAYFDFVEITAYTSDDWEMPSVEEEPDMDCYVPFQWAFKRGFGDAKEA